MNCIMHNISVMIDYICILHTCAYTLRQIKSYRELRFSIFKLITHLAAYAVDSFNSFLDGHFAGI